MTLPPPKAGAFTFVEMLVCVAVIGILVLLAIPNIKGRGTRSMTGTLNNARQLQIATQMMALDSKASGSGLEWTSIKSYGATKPAPLEMYFHDLIENNYLSLTDLQKALAGPGIAPGNDAPHAENSSFKFFWVDEASPSDQPLLVSANWEAGHLTDNAPYGKKGFVLFTKGGSGGIYTRPTDVANTTLFPTGPKYHFEILK